MGFIYIAHSHTQGPCDDVLMLSLRGVLHLFFACKQETLFVLRLADKFKVKSCIWKYVHARMCVNVFCIDCTMLVVFFVARKKQL